MNVLLIGIGRWGRNHLRILSGIREINLFVSDIDSGTEALLDTYHIPRSNFSKDYRDFLRKCDVVFIVTPADVHAYIAMEAMDAGCDIFIEKPMCTSYREAMEICNKAEGKDVIIQVGHIFRFHPITEKVMLPILKGKELGKVKYMKGSFKGFKRPRMDVGVTMTDSIHFVDLFSYALGTWPERVYGRTMDVLGRGMDDLSLSILRFHTEDGETVGFIESGYFQPRTMREVMISGTKRSAILNFRDSKVILKENVHIKRENGWEAKVGKTEEMDVEFEEPLLKEVKSFLECVRERKKPLCTALDGARALRIVECIYESSKKGKEINVTF